MQFCDSPALCSAGLWPWASLLLSTHTLLFCLILQNLLPVVLESCPFTCRSAHTEMRQPSLPLFGRGACQRQGVWKIRLERQG